LDLVQQLNHVDNTREGEVNVSSGISYIMPMPQVVYTGDEDGRVVSLYTDKLIDIATNTWTSMNGIVYSGIKGRLH
jgi:hypothetical protein